MRDTGDEAQDGCAQARQDGNGVHKQRLDRFEGAKDARKHDDRHGAEKQAQQCDRHAGSLPRQPLCSGQCTVERKSGVVMRISGIEPWGTQRMARWHPVIWQ